MTTEGLSAVPDPGATSESEEMYLITVARVAEEGDPGPVPVAEVAKRLQVSVASTNEMVRKLTSRDLLTYEPYRGVRLTPLGSHVAQRVLRTRRLWASFLAEHLGLSPQEADDQACLLEHVTFPDAVDRLASFLGDPDTGPLGKPIPHKGAEPAPSRGVPLTDLAAGDRADVVAVGGPKPIRSFLTSVGVAAGITLTVRATSDSAVLVQIGDDSVHLDDEVAESIVVDPG